MTTIRIFEFDKDRLEKIAKFLETEDKPLMTYADVVGHLIREYLKQFEGGEN